MSTLISKISNNSKAVALFLSLLLIILPLSANAGKCYSKDDIGLGGEYIVPAIADVVSSNKYFAKISRDDTQVRLLRTGPDKSKQFISWLDTGLVINPNSSKLTFYVEGQWSPWGQNFDAATTCECVASCASQGNPKNVCASGGIQVSSNYEGGICYQGKFSPCTIQNTGSVANSRLYGLYGLIATSSVSGSVADPNNQLYWDILPNSVFRTFHIVPDATGFFTLNATEACTYKPGDQAPVCTTDTVDSLKTAFKGSYQYPIMQGNLYLKIIDGYYEDNSGSYTVVVSDGAVVSMGVIESIIIGFQNTILNVARIIKQDVSNYLSVLGIARVLLLLYIILSGILFAMGMIQTNVADLVKRLLKIGIIATIISPTGFEFFDIFLFSFIQGGFNALAEMILNATQDPSNPLQASFAVAAGQTPLAVYDKIVGSVLSVPLHVKIWSLLFFRWGGLYIIAIYIGIFYILLAISKTLMMYIVSIINMAILTALFPIFIIMIIFEITSSFFDSWLKSFLANAMTVMFIFASIALIMTLLFGLLQSMMAFKVCWRPVWDFPLLNKLNFWLPSSYSDVKKAVTLVNVLAFVVIAVVFDKFTGEIPTIAESITGGSSGIKDGFSSLKQGIGKIIATANVANPIGLALSAYKAFKKASTAPMKLRDTIPTSSPAAPPPPMYFLATTPPPVVMPPAPVRKANKVKIPKTMKKNAMKASNVAKKNALEESLKQKAQEVTKLNIDTKVRLSESENTPALSKADQLKLKRQANKMALEQKLQKDAESMVRLNELTKSIVSEKQAIPLAQESKPVEETKVYKSLSTLIEEQKEKESIRQEKLTQVEDIGQKLMDLNRKLGEVPSGDIEASKAIMEESKALLDSAKALREEMESANNPFAKNKDNKKDD